jgi:hypothetical protein
MIQSVLEQRECLLTPFPEHGTLRQSVGPERRPRVPRWQNAGSNFAGFFQHVFCFLQAPFNLRDLAKCVHRLEGQRMLGTKGAALSPTLREQVWPPPAATRVFTKSWPKLTVSRRQSQLSNRLSYQG